MSLFESSLWPPICALVEDKPWVLLISKGDTPSFLHEDSQVGQILKHDFHPVQIPAESSAAQKLANTIPGKPTFVLLASAGANTSAATDEKKFLQFLLTPEYAFSAEISRQAQDVIARSSPEDVEQSIVAPKSTKPCILSIRLMHGETVQATFDASDNLKDVKRWLQQEKNLSLIPEEDEAVSRYVSIGNFEPSRFAFFFPATRTTFSEAQEYSRLEDLGLCSRLAILLRPDFDENAMNAARAAEAGSFKKLAKKTKHMLLALYQFFDYGVDEAQRDFQEFTDQMDLGGLPQPPFLGSASTATPATSLTNIPTTSLVVDDDAPKQPASSRVDVSLVNLLSSGLSMLQDASVNISMDESRE